MPLRAEVLGSLMEPGKDQIPRSASDWHAIQEFVLAGGDAGPVGVWVSHDAPLVQFGDINTGKYQETVKIEKPLFYSWPINNYWFTNFPAEQGGEFRFRYSISGKRNPKEARRFARERVSRPRSLVVPSGREGSFPAARASFLEASSALQGVKPAEDGRGFIVRLRNFWAEPTEAAVAFSPFLKVESVEGVDILERPKKRRFTFEDGKLTVRLKPHEACDFRVRTAQ